ncbi:MAG: RES family NAD+ phosphorylase [Nitrococcus sp.]|nr:RES family NAD+ phosphorylase [Nitrococcus sp.]
MAPRSLLDRELLDTLETVECRALQVQTWRVAWRSQNVLRGGQNGRWNPPPIFALYTSLDIDGAVSEVYSLLSKMPVFSSAGKLIYQLAVRTQNTLILDEADNLKRVGVDLCASPEKNIAQCQRVGEAAYRLDCDSLLVPSMRWECNNLVLFQDVIDPADIKAAEAPHEINWPAWSEKNAEVSRAYTRRFRKEKHNMK